MEENRKMEILNSLIIFFRNHQRYEMSAYIRSISKTITSEDKPRDRYWDNPTQYYLSDKIEDPSINNSGEYEFVISLIDEYPIRGHFVNQNDTWTIEEYKNLINTKGIRRTLALEKIGI